MHDVDDLITGLESKGLTVPESVKASVVLTTYASNARYPGPEEELMEKELSQAIVLAEAVVRWAESLISAGAVG